MDKTSYSPEYRLFLEHLRQARRASGLAQQQVAQQLEEPQSVISRWESGQTQMSLVELRAYCHAVGASLSEFVSRFEVDVDSGGSA